MVVMALTTTFMATPAVIKLYPEWYQKQQAEKTGDQVSAKASTVSPDKTPSPNTVPARYCLVTMLNRLENVPSVMSVIKLLKHHHQPSTYAPTTLIEIHALRLLELTQRASDVMKIRDQRETLRYDPVLNVIRTFADLASIDILRTRLEFLMPGEFVKAVADHSERVQADMILLPWTTHRLLSSQDLNTLDPFMHEDMHNYSPSDAEFVENAFAVSHTTVGIFIDRGFAHDATSSLRIIVPFFGGRDDRAALSFALRLQYPSKC